MDALDTPTATPASSAAEEPPLVQLKVREFEPGDTNFVFHTWLKSYRHKVHTCPDSVYYPSQQALIVRLCGRSRCWVACAEQDPTFILGYVVAEQVRNLANTVEPLVAHYGFTKLSYRKLGVMRTLLRKCGWDYGRMIHVSHWTQGTKEIHKAGKFNMIYNPYQLMELKHPLQRTL